MEEFEEAERKSKTNTKKPLPAEPVKRLVAEPPPLPPPQEFLQPKKAYKSPPLITTALAAKIASSTPGLPPKVRAENVTLGRSKSGTKVSPRSVANAIRLDQFSEQEKESVIKLLLSSPILATNPVLSTKSVAGTSPPVENPLPSSEKLSEGKKGGAVMEGSTTDLANLKLALSMKKKKSATIRIENVEEPEKSRPFNYDLDIDSSTLDTHSDVSLMEVGDDDGLMMSEEETVQAKPVKSAKKIWESERNCREGRLTDGRFVYSYRYGLQGLQHNRPIFILINIVTVLEQVCCQ